MEPSLKDLLETLRTERAFDAQKWIDNKVKTLNEYMTRSGLKACCLGVSGGIDSSVTIALCCLAMKQQGSSIERVLGMALPIHSTASIQNRAYEVCEAIGAEYHTADVTAPFDSLQGIIDTALDIPGGRFSAGQLRSYLRTPCLYYTAQLLSQNGTPCVVMGTGNFDEDGYLYYFCKAGDGVADLQLIFDLHKSEVYQVGRLLGLPSSVLDAAPSADLWEGQTDEDEMGVTYDFVELYTELMKLSPEEMQHYLDGLSPAGLQEFNHDKDIVDAIHRRNKHKEHCPLNL